MWKISDILCLLILIVAAIRDVKTHSVSVWMLGICGMGSILYTVYQLATGEINCWLIVTGAIVGGCFLIISKVTGESFGYGDSFMILFLGIFVGFWRILTILSIAFLLLLCVTIPVLWKKKMSRKCSLPFLPFLTGGYLWFMILGGSNG